MAHASDTGQVGLFGPAPAPAPYPGSPAAPPRRAKSARAVTPAVAQDVLTEVDNARYGLMDDTDRLVWFEDAEHVRYAHDEEIVHNLLANRYVQRCAARETVTARHGAIRRPVLPLRLTKAGRALLARWSALANY